MLPTAHGSARGECATATALTCSTRGMKRRQEQLAGEKMLEEASRNKDRETEKDKQNICRKSSPRLELKINPGKQGPVHKSNKHSLSYSTAKSRSGAAPKLKPQCRPGADYAIIGES